MKFVGAFLFFLLAVACAVGGSIFTISPDWITGFFLLSVVSIFTILGYLTGE